MDGLRIRFPGYILSEHTKASDQTTSIDLSSFNLNLGDYGSARLVATLNPGATVDQSTISVILSNVDGEDSSLSISCSLLVVNEHGEQISKTELVKSQQSASPSSSTSVQFPVNLVDPSGFSLVVIPIHIILDNVDQALVESLQSVTESDSEFAKRLFLDYQEEQAERQKANDPKRKFKCDLCSFRAMTAVGLKKHLNKVHPYPD